MHFRTQSFVVCVGVSVCVWVSVCGRMSALLKHVLCIESTHTHKCNNGQLLQQTTVLAAARAHLIHVILHAHAGRSMSQQQDALQVCQQACVFVSLSAVSLVARLPQNAFLMCACVCVCVDCVDLCECAYIFIFIVLQFVSTTYDRITANSLCMCNCLLFALHVCVCVFVCG